MSLFRTSRARVALAVLLLTLLTGVWSGADTPPEGKKPAPPPARPGRVEEEDEGPAKRPGTPPGRPGRVEEEDEAPRVRRDVLDIGDKVPPGKRDERPSTVPEIDLKRAARDARNPEVRKLLQRLAVPHEQVTLRKTKDLADGRPIPSGDQTVRPLPFYVDNLSELRKNLDLEIIDAEGKVRQTVVAAPYRVVGLRYYEQVAEDEVRAFLNRKLHDRKPESPEHLGRVEQLALAEQVLSAVVRFHRSSQPRGPRKGDEWAPVLRNLQLALLGVQVDRVSALVAGKEWGRAFELARTLARPNAEHEPLVKPVEALLEQAARDPAFAGAPLRRAREALRAQAEATTDRRSPLLGPIEKSLQAEAGALLVKARDLAKEKGNERQVLELLRQAEELWPSLPGLRTDRQALGGRYPILVVGVRRLPQRISPALAATDVERAALDLVFEGLVKLTPDAGGLLHPRPALAEARPRVVPLGREFRLPRDLKWSDGKALNANDLRGTVRRLQEGKGRAVGWGDFLAGVQIGGDSTRVQVRLHHGALEPLSLMSFPVLPDQADVMLESFARKPVGTGPFRYEGEREEARLGRTVAVFKVNPHYGERAGRLGLPRIREVLFVQSTDPVKDLTAPPGQRIHLALDLTAKEAATLGTRGEVTVLGPGSKVVNRRVYFLAVNHQSPLLKRASLRLAVARAINRGKLLDDHFRGPLKSAAHRPLNGPYPPGSWACDPGPKADPHDPDLARTKFNQAKAEGGLAGASLTLKYPSGDPVLARAMEDLCLQLGAELKLKVEAKPRDPQELREDVEVRRDYQLAYYCHDFLDDTYNLLPLLGRGNYFNAGGAFPDLINAASRRRYFARVQADAQLIHREFLTAEMPFIPLWQLDGLAAWRSADVEPTPFDPHRPFADVEHWRLLQND